MVGDDPPVYDYAFTSISTQTYAHKVCGASSTYTDEINAASGSVSNIDTTIKAVPRNFFNVTGTDFYIPTEMQKVSSVPKLPDGKIDGVGLLYSNESMYTYPTYPGDDQDAYNIGVQDDVNYSKKGTSTLDFGMLLPYGLSGPMGISAGDLIRWTTHSGGTNTYLGTARGLVTKMPGFYFSGLNVVALAANALISMDGYK
jgi:hypothetical protein